MTQLKTWVEISKKNLLHNVGQFLKLLNHVRTPAKDRRLQKTQFMAVVKSNAYGHGLLEVASIIHNSKFIIPNSSMWFGVDNLDEAAVVRAVAPKHPVLVLGYTQNDRLKEAAKLGARITVYNWETVRALGGVARDFMSRSGGTRGAALQGSVGIRVHAKVETGTTRQGIGEDEVVEYVKALRKIRGVEIEGISTHFANSEDTRSDYAQSQIARYNSVIARLERAGIRIPVRHMTCTAAMLRYPQTYGNLVRVGIGLYGLWPSREIHQAMSLRAHAPEQSSVRGFTPRSNLTDAISRSPRPARAGLAMTELGGIVILKPVLTWKTIVAQMKEVKKGTPVGYDLTERVKRDSKIAILPVGYWDGYDRGLSKIGQVLIGGKRCKIVGRVCMNMCMADITDAGNVKPEDEVVLLGMQGEEEVSAEDMAKKIDTINYEVVTRINPLLSRIIAE